MVVMATLGQLGSSLRNLAKHELALRLPTEVTVRSKTEAADGTILGREITVQAGGVHTRPDILVQYGDKAIEFVEVKNGPGAVRLSTNQAAGFPVIRAGGAVPVGANAQAA